MNLCDVFEGKAAEIYYKLLPRLGLVPSEKRAQNQFCEFRRGVGEYPWPGIVIREIGGKFVIFKADLENAANDAQILGGGAVPAPAAVISVHRKAGRPRKKANV